MIDLDLVPILSIIQWHRAIEVLHQNNVAFLRCTIYRFGVNGGYGKNRQTDRQTGVTRDAAS